MKSWVDRSPEPLTRTRARKEAEWPARRSSAPAPKRSFTVALPPGPRTAGTTTLALTFLPSAAAAIRFGCALTVQASAAVQWTVPTLTTPVVGTVRTLAVAAAGTAIRAPARASTPIATTLRARDT